MFCEAFLKAKNVPGILYWINLKILVVRRLTAAVLARATECLRAEVETYSRYLDGDVYGYRLFGPEDTDTEHDSCWGFYGQEACLAAACGSIDAILMQS